MIHLPESKIIEKIRSEASLTQEELDQKIKTKLDELSGLISREGALHIIANELKVDLNEASHTPIKINEVTPQLQYFEVAGKILRIYDKRTFVRNEQENQVQNLLMGDESGVIRLVFWGDQVEQVNDFSEGDILLVKGGFSKENQNRTEIHVNSRTEITKNPDGVEIGEVKKIPQQTSGYKKISAIAAGDRQVSILGTIVQVFDIRFFRLCPECNKKVTLQNGAYTCGLHGSTDSPILSYVLNLILDDGSETIRVVCFGDVVAQTLQVGKDELISLENGTQSFETYKEQLTGSLIVATGNARMNQVYNTLELQAFSIDPNPDPKEEMKHLDELYTTTNPTQEQ